MGGAKGRKGGCALEGAGEGRGGASPEQLLGAGLVCGVGRGRGGASREQLRGAGLAGVAGGRGVR